MQRFGQILRLREGAEEEYERCHAEIWPEVKRLHLESGVCNYSIFRYSRWIFSYFELPDDVNLDEVQKFTAESRKCREWEEAMHTLQEPLPESEGKDWWVTMKEIWHLEDIKSECSMVGIRLT